jgi:hypothetical protein
MTVEDIEEAILRLPPWVRVRQRPYMCEVPLWTGLEFREPSAEFGQLGSNGGYDLNLGAAASAYLRTS